MSPALRRSAARLRPDPSRVIARMFIPGEERPEHDSRSAAVINRVLALDEATVGTALAATVRSFAGRHRNLRRVFAEHYASVGHRVADGTGLSEDREQLIGAYFTHEYAVEGAALCNPSMVPAPDQSGVPPGSLRAVMSVRGIGEGHQSSVGFRTATLDADGAVAVDPAPPLAVTGDRRPAVHHKSTFTGKLTDLGDDDEVSAVLNRYLPERFTDDELESLLAGLHPGLLARRETHRTVELIRWIAACAYTSEFAEGTALGERVLWPSAPAERQGIEDARFVRFTDSGTSTYYATYTAYDGSNAAPHLVQTDDFRTFHFSPTAGVAARNKGMALFPRRIGGRYAALTRGDGERTFLATSEDLGVWGSPVPVHAPAADWELVQVGNCGSPLETPRGWLVLTHGVGPMRVYSMGAMLLDIDHPDRVLAALPRPLLTSDPAERDGYVPNVVYSCGGLLHAGNVVIPHGIADASIGVFSVPLTELLDAMLPVRR
ncbi:glycoside hydrolase family 130 protein [Actinokineospora guangxiensis]|uniref:Glycoside hydrolase family 130 protein n=1 Tax=Actinokineospora guangxiensis TaxID=1490288 RepID=A0ABW0EP00_9PSEU